MLDNEQHIISCPCNATSLRGWPMEELVSYAICMSHRYNLRDVLEEISLVAWDMQYKFENGKSACSRSIRSRSLCTMYHSITLSRLLTRMSGTGT
jgi:hypothetical protein